MGKNIRNFNEFINESYNVNEAKEINGTILGSIGNYKFFDDGDGGFEFILIVGSGSNQYEWPVKADTRISTPDKARRAYPRGKKITIPNTWESANENINEGKVFIVTVDDYDGKHNPEIARKYFSNQKKAEKWISDQGLEPAKHSKYITAPDGHIKSYSEPGGYGKSAELFQAVMESIDDINENKLDDLKQALHLETNPTKAKKLKLEIGKMFREKDPKDQEKIGNTHLSLYRSSIGYVGDLIDVYDPKMEKSAQPKPKRTAWNKGMTSNPHGWTMAKYKKWIKDMASGGGAYHAFDMAQNALHEPGLIDFVQRKVVYDEDPLDRIQWDIEMYA
jgi:hypothetical protein